ncbi:type III PLP-dependent enzyme [Amycolatopsis azurea]|uniref:ornithine decarboxylase n=1 Tax=Amycolatopsis azurea DSM 43854 TaxID=1238180 RepID=M2QS14_9PSEU|nr:type III PLP-dependent enzyme [Amycolatopsis azurea]EMD28627.1 Ornithine decarboxylase [Amycolatopsis azurea DSM 43854]OOC08061.1 ornithine decarboxylase [Amycolatopsis azurea DSM 43854]
MWLTETDQRTFLDGRVREALSAAGHDQLVLDLAGIERAYEALTGELPGVAVRFAMKACPVDEVLTCLASRGAGFDAASPDEIVQALATGTRPGLIHYGNTVKSDENIAEAYRLGVRDFATDSVEDVLAIAANAPGARVFCRLATTGAGALWGLGRKYGCAGTDAIQVMLTARRHGLIPAGLSVHVGSQQMTVEAWHDAFERLADVLVALSLQGVHIDHVNLGGGLPAAGYLDKAGNPLLPPIEEMFAALREGMLRLRRLAGRQLAFVVEPGRHLVAEHGAIRAHVSRLSSRRQLTGVHEKWLYLSCGKFNGLYETDMLRYRLVFPGHRDGEHIPAIVAGPTCDSDDVFSDGLAFAQVPQAAESGDPVWILACGAYSMSYTTRGFNGFAPLPITVLRP